MQMSIRTHQYDRKKQQWYKSVHETYYARVLKRTFLKLRVYNIGFDRAEDIAQDVFATAYRKADTLMAHPNIEAWLMTAISHTVNNEHRRQMRSRGIVPIDTPEIQPDMSVDAIEAVEHKILVTQVIQDSHSTLSSNDYALFVKYFIEARPLEALCEEYGLSNGAMRTRLSRIKAKVKAQKNFENLAKDM